MMRPYPATNSRNTLSALSQRFASSSMSPILESTMSSCRPSTFRSAYDQLELQDYYTKLLPRLDQHYP